MQFREATPQDIPQLSRIRLSVTENVLSDPSLVTEADYVEFLTNRGQGWVAEEWGDIRGFAIADLKGRNIWALFTHPAHEGKGIGKMLHRMMLNWYFAQTTETIWLSTAFDSRAETFYRMQGWAEAGAYSAKELKFEMSHERWLSLHSKR